jgi:hypothetical protein
MLRFRKVFVFVFEGRGRGGVWRRGLLYVSYDQYHFDLSSKTRARGVPQQRNIKERQRGADLAGVSKPGQ